MNITDPEFIHRRARITTQGQITVPKAVRDALGVKPGDELEFESTADGMVVRPRQRRSVLDFAGIAAGSGIAWPKTRAGLRDLIESAAQADAAARESRVARGEHSQGD